MVLAFEIKGCQCPQLHLGCCQWAKGVILLFRGAYPWNTGSSCGLPSTNQIQALWKEFTRGLLRGWSISQSERAGGCSAWRQEVVGGENQCILVPGVKVQRKLSQMLFSDAQVQDWRQWVQTEAQEVSLNIRNCFLYLDDDRVLSQIAWDGCGASILRDTQKPEHGPGQPAAGEGGWMRWSSEVSSSLNYSVITQVHFAVG